MQTEAVGSRDAEALLYKQSKIKPKWTTIQLIIIAFIVMVTTALVTNMDRIVDAIRDNNSDSSSNEITDYEFGHNAKKLFALDSDYKEFNFGAYGNAPHDVMKYQNEKRLEIEACPTCWFRYDRTDTLNTLLQRLAEYLGIEDWTDLAYIINASHGMNAVLRSITQTLYNDKCRSNITTCKILQFN
eukprot:415088_1